MWIYSLIPWGIKICCVRKAIFSCFAHFGHPCFKALSKFYQKVVLTEHFKTQLPYSIRMYWINFWLPTVHAPQNIFSKTLIEIGTSHIYASFCTFCVQIGQLFGALWVFVKCMKTVKSLFSKENEVDFEFFRKFKVYYASTNKPIWT